jgi:4-amino-4-deoxy-L-arabinose transferase-like glycosyltransferase
VAAVAASIAGPVVFSGSFLSYMTFDMFCWVAVAWCTACLLRSQNPRWWLAIGAAIGLGIMCKYTMLFLVAGLLGGTLLTPNRPFLRSIWFWTGIALALAIISPVVFWQFQHHFVGLDWMKSIHARDIRWGRTDYFLVNQLWKATNPITVPLWCTGLWFLFATPQGKPFRLLGWMYVIPLVIFLIAKGRGYYLVGAYPMLYAAGSVCGEQWITRLPSGWRTTLRASAWTALALNVVIFSAVFLPVTGPNSRWWRWAASINGDLREEVGWPELVQTVAQIRDSLSPQQRSRLGILAGDYGAAGAIDLYGSVYGLPPAISGINSFWQRGYGDPPPETLIILGASQRRVDAQFTGCRIAARSWNRYGVINEQTGDRPNIFLCGPPRQPWPDFWRSFRYYG